MASDPRHNPESYPWTPDRDSKIVLGTYSDVEFEFGRVTHVPVERDGVVA